MILVNVAVDDYARTGEITVQDFIDILKEIEEDTGEDIMSCPIQINGGNSIFVQKMPDGTVTINDEEDLFGDEDEDD